MVFDSSTIESVEFNASTGLLVIRNPHLALDQENSILHTNGWEEATESDLPEEGLPPTPRVKGHPQQTGLFSFASGKHGNKLKRGIAAGDKESKEKIAEEGRASNDAGEIGGQPALPAFGGNKRVYKRTDRQ